MSEAAHGSDVQHLRTIATYDPDIEEFVICTPSDEDHKEYIGNAACHGRMAAVFAQLIVAGESQGVHALVVPLRDEQGELHASVRIEDRGEKMGRIARGLAPARLAHQPSHPGKPALGLRPL